jgi:hypothetical protein
MKNALNIVLLFLVVLFCSCDESSIKASLDKQLSGTDMVKIYFFDKTGNLSAKSSIITIQDKEIIAKLLLAITDETSPEYKCGYTGSIEYFKENKSVLVGEFNSMPECSHIVFRLKKNMHTKKLSPESLIIINKYYEMIDSQNKASLN